MEGFAHCRFGKLPLHIASVKAFLSHLLLLLLLVTCSVTASPAHAQQIPKSMRLAKIEVTGLERHRKEQIITESGLQIGQTVDADALDAAASRLIASGLFKNLSYRLSAKGDEAVVTFVVEEAKSSVPVVFDNFVWFSNDELVSAVRQHVPEFNGTAPEAGTTTDKIAKALNELLRERKIAGQVEYTPSADAAGKGAEHVFAVKGGNVRVCALHFPGAAAVTEKTLVENSNGIFNNKYSRKFITAYAESNLIPLYRERGRLRAAFLAPQVKPLAASPECADGVDVTMQIDEGMAYVWEKAEWMGNQSLTMQELDAALGMKRDELANGLRIDKNLDDVRRAYGRKGYLATRLSAAPEFDDANRRVTYRFNVDEGAQYRMGTLFVTGLSERDTNDLKTRWQLLPREVYDVSYINEFLQSGVREFFKSARSDGRTLSFSKVGSSTDVDREKLTVDVTINFKQ